MVPENSKLKSKSSFAVTQKTERQGETTKDKRKSERKDLGLSFLQASDAC